MLNDLLTAIPFMTDARAALVIDAFWPMVKACLIYSIPIAIASFIIGSVLALVVALLRTMPLTGVLRIVLLAPIRFYVSLIRGTPILVQIMIVFYGLPAIGILLDPVPTAIIAFSLNIGAYASETMRAAILSIPKGQWEAGFTIGMSYLQTFSRIIMPQAIRVAVPPLANTFISLFKETSLASVVTITEMFRTAQQIANRSYDFLPVYIEAAIIYWIFCFVLSIYQEKLERYFSRSVAR